MRKFLALLVTLALPLSLWASKHNQMMKGAENAWEGFITGNHCALMGMACDPSHVKDEIPVFVPKSKTGYDYQQLYYLVGVPKDKQEALFGKKVRLKGMLYKKHSSISVDSVELKEGGMWKTFWTANPMQKM